MSKKKKLYPKYQKKALPTSEVASSELEIYPNATLGPDASLENSTTGYWTNRDSTSAPSVGEEEEIREPYAKSYSELFDKYVMTHFGREYIPLLIVMAVIGYTFIQDNGVGKLSNWDDIKWFILKSGVILGIGILILGIQWIYKITKKE